MKKDIAKILAAAVYGATLNKSGRELDSVISNFSIYLAEHHLVAMIPNILSELEKLHFIKTDTLAVKIISHQPLSSAEIKKIEDLIIKKTKKKIVVSQEEDKDILGGAVIKYDDKIIDLSIRYQLKNLAKQLSN